MKFIRFWLQFLPGNAIVPLFKHTQSLNFLNIGNTDVTSDAVHAKLAS